MMSDVNKEETERDAQNETTHQHHHHHGCCVVVATRWLFDLAVSLVSRPEI